MSDETLRRCGKCTSMLPPSAFSPQTSRCKPCNNAANRAWRDKQDRTVLRAEWREYQRKHKGRHRSNVLRHRYGLSAEQYAELVGMQGGACAICKRPPTRKGLVVDHCHASGVVRGLLCNRCNTGIGMLADSPAQLRAAATYLEERVNGILSREAV